MLQWRRMNEAAKITAVVAALPKGGKKRWWPFQVRLYLSDRIEGVPGEGTIRKYLRLGALAGRCKAEPEIHWEKTGATERSFYR